MTKNVAIVGVGSNINADKNISEMLKILRQRVEVLKISSFAKTKPIGMSDQPDFTNGAVKIRTKLEKNEFNNLLKDIEDLLGRDRTTPKFGPRTMDLDIIIWNGKVVDDDYYSRDFLKKSVQELV